MTLSRRVALALELWLVGLLSISLTLTTAAEPAAPIGQWTSLTALPQPRASLGVVAQTGEWLYSIGGRAGDGNATADVWRARVQADGSLSAWTGQSTLPVRLCLHAVVTSGGYVYVIGGYDDANYHSEVWRAQIAADGSLLAWQRDRDYPLAVTLHAAVVANGRIYVSGGDTTQGRTNRVFFASAGAGGALGSWQEVTGLPPTSLYRHAMAATTDAVYVTGGYDGSAVRAETYSARINANGTLGAWQATAMPVPREYHQSVVHDGRLVLLGGRNSAANGGLTRVDAAVINADGSLGAWAAEPPLPEPLYRLGAAAVRKYGSDYMYVLGGLSGTQYRANVYRSAMPPTPTPTPTLTRTRTPTPTRTRTPTWTPTATPESPRLRGALEQRLVGNNRLQYEILVENISSKVAYQVIVTNQVPGGAAVVQVLDGGRWLAGAPAQVVWGAGSLAPGASTWARYVVQVVGTQASATEPGATAGLPTDTSRVPLVGADSQGNDTVTARPSAADETTTPTAAAAAVRAGAGSPAVAIYNVGAVVTWWGDQGEYSTRTNPLYWQASSNAVHVWLPMLTR